MTDYQRGYDDGIRHAREIDRLIWKPEAVKFAVAFCVLSLCFIVYVLTR